ncbi:hypothetical protein IC765_19600 (plasmid) [Acinetobacter seifertii]|nr:hypothetical protein IC765_19600 [Acinetobacter seifertii]
MGSTTASGVMPGLRLMNAEFQTGSLRLFWTRIETIGSAVNTSRGAPFLAT